MTFRAVLLGLLGALFIACFGYINDSVLRLTFLVGNHFPISVFGLLIILVIAINPLLSLFGKSLRFRAAELAVIVALMLAACSIPGSGLMRTFTMAIGLPTKYNQQIVDWRRHDVLSYVPPAMMPGPPGLTEVVYDPVAMDTFLTESPDGSWWNFGRVPWDRWSESMGTWLPIIFLISAAVICLSIMIHSQWSRRERLRYPIAAFAKALTDQDPDRKCANILHNKLFWVGLIAIFSIRAINGINAWNDSFIRIPLSFDFSGPIQQKWPTFGRAGGGAGGYLMNVKLFPTAVAFAFFLSADVALSLGLSQYLYVFLSIILVTAGVRMESDYHMGGPLPWQLFGSYLGIGLLILYIGRRYYWQLFRSAIMFARRPEVESSAAWAARMFVLCVAAATVVLSVQGLNWPFALMTVLLVMLMFLVMARINAESGLFFIQPSWMPTGVIVGLFGARAVGPQAMIIMTLVCMVLVIDPREATMPFIINGLKISEDAGVKPSRVGFSSILVFGIALAVATPIVLTMQYNSSAPFNDKWARRDVPKEGINACVREMTALSLSGELDESAQMSTVERIKSIEIEPRFVWSVGVGLALALGFSFFRLRFAWWPLHPIMFLVWGTWTMGQFSHSFMLGWFIKMLVVKLGGGAKHSKLVGLMIGVIAGDLLGGLVFMGWGAAYSLYTGMAPKPYYIFPG